MFVSLVRILGLLLALVSATMILPICAALAYGEYGVISSFLIPIIFCFIVEIVLFFSTRRREFKLTSRSGFAVVALAWVSTSFLGAVPFMISGAIPDFADALFESVSGYTTTGATILAEVENLPRSINLWRMQMHWLGGMGIVALTVALLPILGVGGFQLIKAETTGPEKGKITPKITVTAKILWFIYIAFTLVQTVLLMLAGMDFFDALGHSFATVGTGGFSSKNLSLGGFANVPAEWICIIFMLFAGVNFSLYYRLFTGRGIELLQNTELKAYLTIVFGAIFIVVPFIMPLYHSFGTAFRYAAFHVVSIITTTGFSTADYSKWHPAAQAVLFFLMFIGGCSGSTAGGIKVIRWVIMGKQMGIEVKRMLHPHGVFSIQLNKHAARKDMVFNVSAFMFLYFFVVMITAIITAVDGADLLTSVTASLAITGNIGPGFGNVGPAYNFGSFSSFTKYWLSFAMITGRLELYTMLVFFMPAFWKK
ncbi:TrkH family potassium uptake protein [Treponema sp. OMZ 840]